MNKQDIGSYIFNLRNRMQIGQKELAALLGVSVSAISQYENGGGIKLDKIFQLAELFGVSIDEILSGKCPEMSLEEKLQQQYGLDAYDLETMIINEKTKDICEYYKRIKIIKDRFYQLIIKVIFKQRSTSDEVTELRFLWKYFDEQLNTDEFVMNAVKAQDKNDDSAIRWELEKVYIFNKEVYSEKIIELALCDDDEQYMECFEKMVHAMSKIERDLYLSDLVFYDDAPFSLQKVFFEQGAELLFPPQLKRIDIQDDDIFQSLEGVIELDQQITDAMYTYSRKAISQFDFNSFLQLTDEEYKKCIDKNMTKTVKCLIEMENNPIESWNVYKNLPIYIKQ